MLVKHFDILRIRGNSDAQLCYHSLLGVLLKGSQVMSSSNPTPLISETEAPWRLLGARILRIPREFLELCFPGKTVDNSWKYSKRKKHFERFQVPAIC